MVVVQTVKIKLLKMERNRSRVRECKKVFVRGFSFLFLEIKKLKNIYHKNGDKAKP
jgi:hypothetical protein